MAIITKENSGQEIKKLSVEELEGAGGGYTFDPGPGEGFEVIDDRTGKVIAGDQYYITSIYDAQRIAEEMGQSPRRITWSQLEQLRTTGRIDW